MLKLMGSLLILSGGVLVRTRCVAAWRREREALASLTGALERLAEEVRATALPLPRLLSETADRGAAGAFFREVLARLRGGASLPGAWQGAALALPLSPEDCRAVAGAGEGLRGSEEQVCRSLETAAAQLERSLEDARQRARERERQATALSFSGAALLVILLI